MFEGILGFRLDILKHTFAILEHPQHFLSREQCTSFDKESIHCYRGVGTIGEEWLSSLTGIDIPCAGF